MGAHPDGIQEAGPVQMKLLLNIVGISLLCGVAGGCAGWPQPRLDAYLGQLETHRSRVADLSDVVQVGLVMINDTTAPDSAPRLSDDSFVALTEHVRHQLMHAVPVKVVHVFDLTDPAAPPRNFAAALQWGKDRHVEYLVVVMLSSAEIEVPERLPWRGSSLGAIGRGLLLGYRAENLALAELALVDVLAGELLIRVDGNAWASLERLDVPLESNVYPVVRRNLEDLPVYPDSEEAAHDVLRAVAGHDAVNQAIMHLKAAWP